MKGRYYLLAVLDDGAQTRLCELSDELSKQGLEYTRYTPYHITLWDGEKADEEDMARFEKICRKTPALDVAPGFVGMFGLAVAFLAPMPCRALLDLEEKICGRTDFAPDGWAPHITLRIGDPETIKRAVMALAERFTPFPARVERLELYECGENYARFVRAFALAGNEGRA